MIKNRKLTIGELATNLNIAYESVQDILSNDLGLRRVAAKLVPKDLDLRDRVVVAKDKISTAESDPTFAIRLIWLPATSSCSVDSKNRSGERVLAAKRR